MKKPLLITTAAMILLLALLVWGYLFLFGTPKSSDEIYADLGFNITPQATNPVDFEPEIDLTSLVNVEGVPLRQLTVRPIAGFIAMEKEGVNIVRYMERGTGHIYDIDLISGEEVRVSNTTHAKVVDAVFGPTGEYVAFQSENGYTRTTMAGKINNEPTTGNITTTSLPPNAKNLQFVSSTILHYTTTGSGTTGYEFDISNNTQVETFFVPFLYIKSLAQNGEVFVYNSHAPELQGNLYSVSGRSYESLFPQRFGFSALVSPEWITYSYTSNNTLVNEAWRRSNNTVTAVPIVVIPEKCDFDEAQTNILWCMAPINTVPYTYLKDWYQGTVRSNDVIWQVNLAGEQATLALDPAITLGREIDGTEVTAAFAGTSLFFRNKNDDTLWQYDTLAN